MFIIENYFIAVIFCFITMICWGSWANTQKLASQKWPFQLYYWDYALGILLITLIFGFTLGSTGDIGRSFIVDLKQAESNYINLAFLGGVIFNFANLLKKRNYKTQANILNGEKRIFPKKNSFLSILKMHTKNTGMDGMKLLKTTS